MGDGFDPVGFVVGNIIAGAGIALSVLSAGTLSSIGLALASYGIGLMGRSIQGRPSRRNAQDANYDPTATLKVAYGGPLWVGITGADIWVDHDDIADHQSLWTFGVFSIGSENGQGIEAVEKIKIDGIMAIDPVTTGGQVNLETGRTSYYDEDDLLSYNVRLGTDAQGVNTDAQSAASNASDRYPNSFRFRGLCYGAFGMWKHKDKFPNFPRSISALLKGVRVYDPRNPTDGPDGDGFIWDKADTSASLNQHPGRNPALILLDYLTSKRYGDAAFYPERDGGDTSLSEIDEQSFIDGANHCDELVQGGGTGLQPRYSFSDWLDTGNSLVQNTAAILSSMRGILHYQEGRYRLVIPQVQSSVMTLSEDDIIGDWTVRRRGASEVPNRVVAQIPAREGETTTEVQFPDEDDTTFLDQDNGVPQVRTVQLYGVDDPVRAEQLAMISLRESREDAGVSFRATERAAALEVGDVFTLDHAFPGWQDAGAKEFRVLDLTHRPDFTVEVTATEYADSAYSLSSQTRPTPPPGSDLPDPTTTGAPSNLALTSDGTTQVNLPGGDKVPGIEATWDLPTDKGIDRVVVVERENGSGTWNTADVVDPEETQRSLFSPQGAAEGDTWQVGVYVLVGQRLLKSSVTTDTVVVGADFVPGSSVNLLGADAGPEHAVGANNYVYDGFDTGVEGFEIAALGLEVGDVLSVSADAKNPAGDGDFGVLVRFYDASGTQVGSNQQTLTSSTSYERVEVEDITIPTGAVHLNVQSGRSGGPTDGHIRRAMLNKGPVAAPYTDPPPVDAENLLPFSAILDKTVGTAGGAVTDWIALADMGLAPGDVISVSQTFEADAGDTYETEVEINDAADGSGTNVFDERTGEVTGGGRSRFHGIVIPSGGAAIRILGQDVGGPTSSATSSKRMLNRGARAAPFTAPSFREFLDDAFSIWRDLGSQSARVGDIVERIRDSGHADSGFGREDTGGVPRKMPKFPTPRSGLADGETISYGPFDAPPNWSHRQDGYSYQPDSSEWSTPASFDANAPQARRFLLEGVGEGSSTVRAQLQQLGTPTGRSDQWSATSILDTVGETQDSPALSNLPAVNNEFTVRYYWEVTGQDFSDEGPVPIDVTEIEVEVYGVDGSTGSPTLVATDNFQVSGVDPNVTLSGYREVTLTASDVADSGSDFFRLKLTKMEAVSGDIGPDSSSHVDGVDQGLSRDDTEAPGPGISWSTQSKITAPMTSTSQEVFVALNLTDPV